MPRQKILDLPLKPHLDFEKRLWREGFRVVAGLDEAGRGAWAGPVYAGAVVLPADERICDLLSGVRDSKQMSARERLRWEACIKSASVAWAVGFATEGEIDGQGIVAASCLAMLRALERLVCAPEHLLIDYIALPDCGCPQTSLPKGDCRSLSIAAASVLAKTARDAFMISLDGRYPGFGFSTNVGYGTPEHQRALKKQGVLPIHRKTFQPIAALI